MGPREALPGGGWKQYRGHPYQARPETIRIIKERAIPGRVLLAVEFEDTERKRWRYIYGTVQQRDGSWKVEGGAGGAGHEPPRREPWANFGGWGWPRFLCAGGWVHGDDVHRVRMIDATGKAIEDTVDDGISLVMTNERFEPPYRLELYDAGGNLLGNHPWGRPANLS